MGVVDDAIAAVQAGRPVVMPTDTVYGLVTTPYREEAAERLYRLKGRPGTQPSALVASDVDMLFECVPELRGRAGRVARAMLPGPYTLILPNPAKRYRWLCGTNPAAIGVRVPDLSGDPARILARVGALVATSANLPGGSDPRSVDQVPAEIREASVVVDGGELPGVPSTVVDFTGEEPVVLREGAVPAAEALERAAAAVT